MMVPPPPPPPALPWPPPPAAPSQWMPVEHCCMLPGLVSGSHLALRLPSVDLHSTPRICMPCPHDTEHCKERGQRGELKHYKLLQYVLTEGANKNSFVCAKDDARPGPMTKCCREMWKVKVKVKRKAKGEQVKGMRSRRVGGGSAPWSGKACSCFSPSHTSYSSFSFFFSAHITCTRSRIQMQILILFAFCQLLLVPRGVCVTSLAARIVYLYFPFMAFFAVHA